MLQSGSLGLARESPTNISVRSYNWPLKPGGQKGKLLHSTRVKTDLTLKEHDIGPCRVDTTLKNREPKYD